MDRYAGGVPQKYQALTREHIDTMPALQRLSAEERLVMKAVAAVLPFRTNTYIIEELIDWSAIPDDPIYQLVFPQRGMLAPDDLTRMMDLMWRHAPAHEIESAAHEIRMRLNPHPDGQLDMNIPTFDGERLQGVQHKYAQTVLLFPSQGQICHAYCTFCFRWAQFVNEPQLRIAASEAEGLHRYLLNHPEVTDVLITGGDPLIMTARLLEKYIEPLLDPQLTHLERIRIGTKSVAYWPYRFLTDKDSHDLLRLFRRIKRANKQLAIMAHYTHPREFAPPIAQAAIQRILDTGALIWGQGPLVRHINDAASIWLDLWRTEAKLGIIPYYMFVERDTGPKNYFEVPLVRAYEIFRDAYSQAPGLARTVRGPSMSAVPGKVVIRGVAEIGNEQVFDLQFIQARDPAWVGRPFFARFDPHATWLTDLVPAFGKSRFFYEEEMEQIELRLSGKSQEKLT